MTEKTKTPKINPNTKVLYIEPNACNEYNFQKGEQDVDITPNLEDYCTYVDLQIEFVSRTDETSHKTLSCQYNPQTNETNLFEIMQGSYYGTTSEGKSVSALTTNYADIGFKELAQNERSVEYFGINSINISYDSNVCPTVDIEFTDIRGISLFSVEEITHNQIDDSGMNGRVNNDAEIADSFFAAFFKFPYPKFILYVKGFYGEPVAYDLAVSSLKTSFDSKTGNFGATVNFVSYRYGILNDLTMTTLASAVSSEKGRKYWEEHAEKFTYNGQKLFTLAEIAKQYREFSLVLEKTSKEVSDAEEIKAELGDYAEKLGDLFKEYFVSVCSTAKELTENCLKEYNKRIESTFSDKTNKAVIKMLGNQNNLKNVFNKVKTDVLKRNKNLIQASWNDKTKRLDFVIPDGSFQQRIKEKNIRIDYVRLNNFTSNFYRNSKYSYNNKKIVDFKTFSTSDNGYYISPFSANCMINDTIYEDYSGNNGDNLKSIQIYTFNTNFNFYKDNKNLKIAKKYKVGDNYNALVQGIIDLSGQTEDEETISSLVELREELHKCALFLTVPTMSKKPVVIPIINNKSDNTHFGGGFNELILLPSSHYTLNFSKIFKILEKLQIKIDTSKVTSEQLQNDAANKTLTFYPSVRYVTKSLWAHVETFLAMCLDTNSQIRGNADRTPSKMGLTEENSNLPASFYSYGAKDSKLVGAFPVLLKKGNSSGSINSEANLNNVREIYAYIESVYPNSEEHQLVSELITGASNFYTTENEGKNVNGNATVEDIQLETYLYLKQLFDKWIHGISSTEFENQFGINGYFENHFLFIDTFYNKINDEMGVNTIKFAKACYDIFDNKSNTLLSFMSSYLQEVNAFIQPTQGFMLNDIENKDNTQKYYEKIFLPIPFNQMEIPDSSPYFVVIWRGDPSQNLNFKDDNMDDSFLVSEDIDTTITKLPMGLVNKNNVEGYPIPAIGVSYGRQYQNYFIDISLDTSKPMSNEISMAAQFQLVGASTSDGSGSNQQSLHFGQDLYTVYANNSYGCTVTMMGCMWIQPLMYFQLNNVPLFRGTYMIQRVYHTIEPGNITTRFTGVRMSRYSSPFVNKYITLLNGSAEAAYQAAKEKKASYDNNCPYHYYDPNEEDEEGTNTFDNKYLEDKFYSHFPSVDSSLNAWFDLVKDKKTIYALASAIQFENSYDKTSIYLHATILYNRLNCLRYPEKFNKLLGGTWASDTKTFWSSNQWSAIGTSSKIPKIKKYLRNISDNDETVKYVREIMTKSPSIANNLPYDGNGDNKNDEREHISTGKTNIDGLQKLFFTNKNKHKDGDTHILLFAHGGLKNPLGSAYYSIESKKGKWKGVKFWELKPKPPKSTPKEVKSAFGVKLLECIKNTFNNYDKFEGTNNNIDEFFTIKHVKDNNSFGFSLKEGKEDWVSARLIDILFNVYNKYIVYITCMWNSSIKAITNDTNPTDIVCIYSDKDQPVTKITFGQTTQKIVISEGSFPEDIFKVLRKKFGDLKSTKANTYIVNKFA